MCLNFTHSLIVCIDESDSYTLQHTSRQLKRTFQIFKHRMCVLNDSTMNRISKTFVNLKSWTLWFIRLCRTHITHTHIEHSVAWFVDGLDELYFIFGTSLYCVRMWFVKPQNQIYLFGTKRKKPKPTGHRNAINLRAIYIGNTIFLLCHTNNTTPSPTFPHGVHSLRSQSG